ncbi:MAG: ExbD/TolR family protein [Sphingobacterium sp.]|uniref:ExbD/TolR family protein n=1 Tax=Sphingobacterium sp. JB170 TaxID=1434842 RepID=UPI00097F217C|nr:biopolymer transporter ExbD [Sphingobacterium sp. JB170]SJN43027.1 Biopolymer transport protein ExbD/TolR [Sphingobacterium sp. JB170]
MAELNQDSGKGNKGGKVRAKKAGGKVDLTAMVDLAFLLITFFMLTTSLNKPQAMDVAMPDKNKIDKNDNLEIADNRSITLLLGSDNKISWYYGQLANPIYPPATVEYGNDGIREVLLKMQKEVPARAGGKDLIVVIRPSEKSIHRNLVDILDEMKIVDVKRYMISQINDDEIEVLKSEGLFND